VHIAYEGFFDSECRSEIVKATISGKEKLSALSTQNDTLKSRSLVRRGGLGMTTFSFRQSSYQCRHQAESRGDECNAD